MGSFGSQKPQITTPVTGGLLAPVSFGVSIVITLLGALFGGIFGGPSSKEINDALNQLRDQLSQAIDVVTRFSWTIAYALGSFFQLLQQIWIGFIEDVWSWLKRIAGILKKLMDDVLRILIKALKALWNDVLPKLLKIIRQLRQWLQLVYTKYIRPALVYLQYVRKILAILTAFHVKFAAKLDAWLLKWQTTILGPYLYALHVLNMMGSWVNLVVSVKGILQRALFINTMYGFQSDWMNLFWWGQSSGQPGTAIAPTVPPVQPGGIVTVQSNIALYVATDSGPTANDVMRANNAFTFVTSQLP